MNLSGNRDGCIVFSMLPAPSIKPVLVFYAALLASIALFQLGLPGDFLLDDHAHLPLHVDSLTLQGLIDATLAHGIGVFGRYVSFFTFALTEVTTGDSPAAYLNHNILLHALTGCLQFWTLGRLFTTDTLQRHIKDPWLVAASITALWLLHPLLVSTVLYAVQRMTILAALFTWLVLLLYTIGRTALDRGSMKRATLCLFVGVPFSVLLGCLSKENAVLIPIYILLLEWFVFPRMPDHRIGRIFGWAARLLLIGLPMLAGMILFIHAHERFLGSYATRAFSLGERVVTEGYAIWWYIRLIFFPLTRDLSLYQDGFPILDTHNAAAWLAGSALIALFIISCALRRRLPLIGIGVSMFLASHLLESTIIPLELVFEHRNYFGASFLFVAAYGACVAFPLKRAENPSRWRRVPAILFILAVVVFSGQTALRAWTWSDGEMLALTAVQEQPHSVRARVEIANFYLRRGNYDQALELLRNARSIDPTESGLSLHILMVHCITGNIDPAYKRALEALRSDRISAYTVTVFDRLSRILRKKNCDNLGLERFDELVRIATNEQNTLPRWRYYLHDLAARTLAHFGHLEPALRHAEKATQMSANAPIADRYRAFADYAQISIKLGKPDQARVALQKMERLARDPRVSIESEIRVVRRLIKKSAQQSP